ncbi:TetR/AcrR family transcriptional regulator [Rhodococcus maanshanensis]|uniref:TetR/AcrR family transcriptional regulator n=1 Tax=Rhodococcus maanshanensis TaxID=183556 RepID=UPI0022B2E9AF|nr:TetR/AcrR family transcriptional regulator [Rhodococcus maanshanensis]MCZ4556092.1 TetR/AcrR family transcriptional regulator [Rhodococcus maanshanensis]
MNAEGSDRTPREGSPRTRPRPRRRYAPGEERHERILTAAVQHFSRFGYANSSLARIAADAGVSDAGLLHHFGTKKELFLAAIALREDPYADIFDTTGTVRDLFRQFTVAVRNSVHRPELVRFRAVLSGEALLESNPASERLRHYLVASLSVLVPVVERGIEAGEIRPDVDARQVILELLALNEGLRGQWATLPDDIDLPQVFETAADSLLRRITVDQSGLS